ncbi:hypothetical protein [Vandammella animalimorsus]|uniref:hypothetical protein n=1 Tax=Vandammella animalimorsus TaxID=2029117 RepID=UPI0015542654|nr:hypothetical protein [Vandammella animalimorsus]
MKNAWSSREDQAFFFMHGTNMAMGRCNAPKRAAGCAMGAWRWHNGRRCFEQVLRE